MIISSPKRDGLEWSKKERAGLSRPQRHTRLTHAIEPAALPDMLQIMMWRIPEPTPGCINFF